MRRRVAVVGRRRTGGLCRVNVPDLRSRGARPTRLTTPGAEVNRVRSPVSARIAAGPTGDSSSVQPRHISPHSLRHAALRGHRRTKGDPKVVRPESMSVDGCRDTTSGRRTRCLTRHTISPIRWPPALSTRSIDATTTTEVKRPAILTSSRSSTLADEPSRSATTVAKTQASFLSATPTDWLLSTAKKRTGTSTPPSLHGWREPTSLLRSAHRRESAKALRPTAAYALQYRSSQLSRDATTDHQDWRGPGRSVLVRAGRLPGSGCRTGHHHRGPCWSLEPLTQYSTCASASAVGASGTFTYRVATAAADEGPHLAGAGPRRWVVQRRANMASWA